MSILIRNIAPHLNTPQPDEGFWDVLLDIVITVVACAVAGPAGGLFTSVVAQTVAVGVTAALVEAAEQGILVGFGLKEHFSLVEALETGISLGIAKYAGLAKLMTTKGVTLMQELRTVGLVALSNQLQELALGRIKQINFRSLLNAMVTTFIGAEMEVQKLGSIEKAVLTEAMEIPASALIRGYSPSLDMVAAQMLGTIIGNELGGIASQKVKNMMTPAKTSTQESKGYVAQKKVVNQNPTDKASSTVQPKPESKARPASTEARKSATAQSSSVTDPAEANRLRYLLGLNPFSNPLEDAVANALGIPTHNESYFNAAGDEKPPTVSSSALNCIEKIGIGALYLGVGAAEGFVNLTLHPFHTVASVATEVYQGAEFLAKNTGPFLNDAVILNEALSPAIPSSLKALAVGAGFPLTSPVGRESNSDVAAARARMDQRLAPLVQYWENADNATRWQTVGKVVGALALPGVVVKGVSKLGMFARVEEVTSEALDWPLPYKNVGNAAGHVMQEHGNMKLSKPIQGVFFGDPIKVTEKAWQYAKFNDVAPITIAGKDYYIIPRSSAGFEGGMGGQLQVDNHITLVTKTGTNQVITAYPSGATLPITSNNYQYLFEQEVSNYGRPLY